MKLASVLATTCRTLLTPLALLFTSTALLAGSPPEAPSGAAYVPPLATAQELVRNLATPRSISLDGLRAKLDALENDLAADASAGAAPGTPQAAGLRAEHVPAHLRELANLRQQVGLEIDAAHAATPGTVSIGAELRRQIARRFDDLDTALQALQLAKDEVQDRQARLQLRALLQRLHAPAPAPFALTPSMRRITPVGPRMEGAPQFKAAKALPAYALDSLRSPEDGAMPATALAMGGGVRLIRTSAKTPPALSPYTGSDCGSNPADTAADGSEIQFTPEIVALAQSLNYSPVQILTWMQKNIAFQAYWGSAKGAAATLQSRAGNATDQASLLIALLRSANIPARYVLGRVALLDRIAADSPDGKAQRWLGTKNYAGSAQVLSILNGGVYVVNGVVQGVGLDHVWVQACVPYAGYRGSVAEAGGYRWVPMDPSIKDQDYQGGMAVNLPLDAGFYADLLAKRSDDLPTDFLASRTEAAARIQQPDASVEDVPYRGTAKSPRMDVLPGVPPFLVIQFNNWSGMSTSDTPAIPDSHRVKVRLSVNSALPPQPQGGPPVPPETLASTTLTLPNQALSKLSITYAPNAASQPAWSAWSGSLGAPAIGVSVYPRILVDGVEVSNGSAHTLLPLGSTHGLVIELSQAERQLQTICQPDPGSATVPISCINKAAYDNIKAGGYYAIGFNVGQFSDASLQSRAATLATNVTAALGSSATPPTPASGLAYDSTVGDLLHLVIEGYLLDANLAKKRVADLRGFRSDSWGDVGLTGSDLQTSYAFDLPVVIKPGGPYVDVKGGVLHLAKIDSTAPNVPAANESAADFTARQMAAANAESVDAARIANYAASALEHHVWQQVLRTDAVSTVRGLQFANEAGNTLVTLTPADKDSVGSKLVTFGTLSMQPYIASISAELAKGATVTVPHWQIAYTDAANSGHTWQGAVFMVENPTAGHYAAIIAGGLAGGYPLVNSTPVSTLFQPNASAPSFADLADGGTGRLTTLPTGRQGDNPLATLGGDPVNMLTGSFVFNQRDLLVKGRGGFNAALERWYNSGSVKDYGLGPGWTHSFNQLLRIYGVEGGQLKVGWLNGSGGESFFTTANVSGSDAAPGTTLSASPGVWSTLTRTADGNYSLREQDGTTYVFEMAWETANQYRLKSIADRNGNTLSVGYLYYSSCGGGCTAVVSPSPDTAKQVSAAAVGPAPTTNIGISDPHPIPTDKIDHVTDSLGRTLLQFTWDANRTHVLKVADNANRVVAYAYTDGNGNLTQVTDARGKPHGFSYFGAADGAKRDHHLKRLTHPKGNGIALEYYSNGQVFRHTSFDTAGSLIANASTAFEYNPFTRESTTTNERGYRRSYFFDANGNPTRIVDENGAATTYVYDTANPFNRISETDSIGRTTKYSYESANLVATVTLPSGAVAEMHDYNAFAQPQRSKDAVGNWSWLRYDAQGNLTDRIALAAGAVPAAGVQPAAANILAWARQSFDAYGNPVTSTRVKDFNAGSGPSLTLGYDGNALNVLRVTRAGNRNGTQVSETSSPDFTYDALNRRTGGIDGRWYPTSASFDAQDRSLTQSTPLGGTFVFSYDDNGNLDGRLVQIGTASVDSVGFAWDDRDRMTSETDNAGATARYDYDEAGNLIRRTSRDGYVTDIAVDAANRPVATFDESGNQTSTRLDTVGRPLSVTDPNGNSLSYSYWNTTTGSDALNFGRLRRVTAPATQGQSGRATEYAYDAAGRVVLNRRWASDASSHRESYAFYDELGRAVRAVGEPDNSGQRLQTCTRYDTLGNLTEVWAGPTTDTTPRACNFGDAGLVRQLSQTWDDFGELLRRTDPLGKAWNYSYDLHGNLATSQSPEQAKLSAPYNVTTYTPDPPLQDANGATLGTLFGLVKARTVNDSAGANPTSSYTYNALGQPLTEQVSDNAGSVAVNYVYQYDDAHRLRQVTDSRGLVVNYSWTPGGRLANVQARAQAATSSAHYNWDYKYDNLGRLSLIVPPNGQNVTFSYDAAGRLIERTVAPQNSSASGLLRSTYAWLADGNLASLTHSNDATPLLSTGYDFDAWGNRWHVTRGFSTADQNGTETLTHGYDTLDRLTSVSASGSVVLTPNEGYGYDIFGNRNSRSRSTASGTTNWSYAYDGAQRLTGYSQSIGTSNAQGLLRYDDNGNLLALCDSGYGGNAGDASTASRPDCSATGSGSSVSHMTWNGLEQLLGVAQTYAGQALPSEAYSYDPSGRRIAKARSGNLGVDATSATLITNYAYDGADLLAEWTPGIPALSYTGKALAVYTRAGLDAPVLRHADSAAAGEGSGATADGVSQLYVQDGLGSVIGVLGGFAPVNLMMQPQNLLSSTGFALGNTPPTPLLNDGDTTDSTYKHWYGDPHGASATLVLASSTFVDRVEIVGGAGNRPTQGMVEVRDANGNWSQVASQVLSFDGNNTAAISLTATRAYAVRVTMSGTTSVLASFQVGELRIFSAASVPANYAATQSFDAWGNAVQSVDGVPAFGYTGREPDATGLTYYRARYYHPGLGRFISRDPMGLAAGINPYSYVNGNPVNLVDPMGLVPQGPLERIGSLLSEFGGQAKDFLGQLNRSFGAFDSFVPGRGSFEGGVERLLGRCSFDCTNHNVIAGEMADVFQGAARGVAEAANRYYPDLAKQAVLGVAGELGAFGAPFVELSGAEQTSYLYRGVHAGHPAMEAALQGRVVPGNISGSVSAEAHNLDALNVVNSPFTSWTPVLSIAQNNALKAGPGGVVLRLPVGPPPAGAPWSWEISPDVWGESERLLRGVRNGAEVMHP